jgi:hypothetical protein
MNSRLIILPLLPPTLWGLYTTFQGLSDFFDLPTNPDINPGQFAFAIVATVIVFAFLLVSPVIWSLKADIAPALILRGAWLAAVAINLFASWEGTRRIILYEDEDPAKAVGVAVVAVLVVASTILLSWLPRGMKGG